MSKKRGNHPPPEPEPAPLSLLETLLLQDVPRDFLLASGQHREDGVLAQLSRYELQELVPRTAQLDVPMPKENILSLARWVVERALLVKHGVTDEKLAEYDEKAARWTAFTYTNHAARVAAQTKEKAQRRANTVADEQVAAVKTAAKKVAKKVAEKKAAKVATKKAEKEAGPSVYETMVVATKKEVREGSFFDQVVKFAQNPIKLETLIQKLVKEVGPSLRSSKDPEHVVRTRTRDAFSRLGFLKVAKG
jgi:hypothetical protein